MVEYFKNIKDVSYSDSPHVGELSYRFYNPSQRIGSKTMEEHLKPAVCYWHNFCWGGQDAFGTDTRSMPWRSTNTLEEAFNKADAMFEFLAKLGVQYYTFHDTDMAPQSKDIKIFTEGLYKVADYIERKMHDGNVKLLWGTANLFSNPRYMAGAATNPDPEIFACAIAQVKHAMDITHRLGGRGYVSWGGREGYDTLLNTDLKKEKEQLARFLHLIAEYKYKIGFTGELFIEPKPCEPTKHQYDYDTESVYGFLCQNNLQKEYKVNIESNHATLANHSFEHEVAMACSFGAMGSIDANRGDHQNGWDTDQFPNSVEEMSLVLYRILESGGLEKGGFNFDAKVRRQSIDPIDMFYGHVGGIDVLAKSLSIAHQMLVDKRIATIVEGRYANWKNKLGREILNGTLSIDDLAQYVEQDKANAIAVSGRQEMLENIVANYIHNKKQ